MPIDDIRWLGPEDDYRVVSPDANPALKRGFFLGGGTVVNGLYVHKYGAYRNLEAIQDQAPELLVSLLGPVGAIFLGGETIQGVLDNINTEVDWSGKKLDVYSFEFPGGVFWVANHIPNAPGMSFEMIADHSQCTPEHCTNEDSSGRN